MSLRFVLLSDHEPHARRVAQVFAGRGVKLEAVLVQSGSALPISAGLKRWALRWASLARRRLRFERQQKPFYAPLRSRVLAAGDINSARMRRLLLEIAPDYLVVASGSILKSNIIETAREGVLNVHPGVLPWARGSGVVGHSLARGVPIGATLHFIDAGIDTGAIIERRLLPLFAPSAHLGELEIAAGELAVQLLADAVENIARTGEKPRATVQTARFELFRWTDRAAREPLHALAKSGRACELFDAWKPFTDGAPTWRLPPDLMDAPLEVGVERK